MAINFISSKDSKDSKDFKDSKYSKDSDETPIMHFKSDNIEIMMGSETDEIIEELFEPLLQRYQEVIKDIRKITERKAFYFCSVDA